MNTVYCKWCDCELDDIKSVECDECIEYNRDQEEYLNSVEGITEFFECNY